MLECYDFEECEYNAQPKCCLPNGMECPHGVKAHKPTNADHEKLIERLKNAAGGPEDIKMCQDAATALSTLQAENEKLRDELDEKEKYYDQMIDALAATNSTELEQVKRDFDGLCEYIDSEGFVRKQFCENGNPDLEPCICPSLQEHPGYIDSDDCEGCDHFCNSWCGQRED